MNMPSLPAQAETNCVACNTTHFSGEAVCNFCGYPLKGTEQEQRSRLARRARYAVGLEEKMKRIKQSTYILYGVAALAALYGIMQYASTNEQERVWVLIINLGLSATYIGLGFLSRNKPRAALIIGFSVFILINLLNLLTEPTTLTRGLMIKVVIALALVKGMKAVIEAQKIRKEFNIE